MARRLLAALGRVVRSGSRAAAAEPGRPCPCCEPKPDCPELIRLAQCAGQPRDECSVPAVVHAYLCANTEAAAHALAGGVVRWRSVCFVLAPPDPECPGGRYQPRGAVSVGGAALCPLPVDALVIPAGEPLELLNDCSECGPALAWWYRSRPCAACVVDAPWVCAAAAFLGGPGCRYWSYADPTGRIGCVSVDPTRDVPILGPPPPAEATITGPPDPETRSCCGCCPDCAETADIEGDDWDEINDWLELWGLARFTGLPCCCGPDTTMTVYARVTQHQTDDFSIRITWSGTLGPDPGEGISGLLTVIPEHSFDGGKTWIPDPPGVLPDSAEKCGLLAFVTRNASTSHVPDPIGLPAARLTITALSCTRFAGSWTDGQPLSTTYEWDNTITPAAGSCPEDCGGIGSSPFRRPPQRPFAAEDLIP